MKFLYQKMKIERLRQGMSTYDLAKALEVTQPTVSRYESGGRTPNLAQVEKIADSLKLSAFEFLQGDGEVTMSQKHQLTIRQEATVEFAHQVLSELMTVIDNRNIDMENNRNPLVVLFFELSGLINDDILSASSIADVEHIAGYLQYTRQYLAKLLPATKQVG